MLNSAPIGISDLYTMVEDAGSTNMPSVLANDFDPDGDPLAVFAWGSVFSGTLSGNSNGTFAYTPAANVNGTIWSYYRVTDGELEAMPGMQITITPVNDLPVAVDHLMSMNEDMGSDVYLKTGSVDVDGDALTALIVSGPAHGSFSGPFEDGLLNYTPFSNFHGTDSFTYKLNDGTADSIEAAVNITVTSVNDAPTAGSWNDTIAEDTVFSVSATTMQLSASDPDNDPLTFTFSTMTGGTIVAGANGAFTFTPPQNYSGSAGISYTVTDPSNAFASGYISLSITPVNDPPVAVADAATTSTETEVTINVLTNDTDPECDTLTITAVSLSATPHGTATIGLGGIAYTPDAGFWGTDTFTYTVADPSGASATATVTVNVNAAPVAVSDGTYLLHDHTLTSSVSAVDPDGPSSTFSVATWPSHGTLNLNPSGSFSYTPWAGYVGDDSFDFAVTDGGSSNIGTFAITVYNTDPVALDDAALLSPGETLSSTLDGTDIDADTLAFSLYSSPANGTAAINSDGTFTYTPFSSEVVTDSFQFVVFDGVVSRSGTFVVFFQNAVAGAKVSFADARAFEGDPIVFTVTVIVDGGVPLLNTVTVPYATADATATLADYTATSGTLTFAAGAQGAALSQTISVPTTHDRIVEEFLAFGTRFNEFFKLNFGNPTNAAFANPLATDVNGRILNNDVHITMLTTDTMSVDRAYEGTGTQLAGYVRPKFDVDGIVTARNNGLTVQLIGKSVDGAGASGAKLADNDYVELVDVPISVVSTGKTAIGKSLTFVKDKKVEPDEAYSFKVEPGAGTADVWILVDSTTITILNDD